MNNLQIVEQIDIEEFGWYETWLKEYITGVSVIIIITGHEPYLDQLGPRLRLKITESTNPQDMIPIFLDSPYSTNISDELNNQLNKFITQNYSYLINFWNLQTDYTSEHLLQDIKKI